MSHIKSVGSISCASCGRAGRSPAMTFEMITGVVNSLNGHLPVKTLSRIKIPGESFIPYDTRKVTGTNLYHDHAKRKYVRFLCALISSLQNLRRSPCRSISVCLRYRRRAYSANDRRKLKTRQTSMAVVVNEDVGLTKVSARPKANLRKYLPLSNLHASYGLHEDS